MKKSLLLLATLLSSSAMYAQWVKPVPSFVPMADDGETKQYLYNIEAGGFYTAGNDWQTRASIGFESGIPVKMAQAFDDDEKTVPLDTWEINDSVPKFYNNTPWRKTFADNPESIWVDNANGANVQGWIVTALGNNKYEITNPGAGSGKLGMVETLDGAGNNTRLWLLDPNDERWLDAEENLRYTNPMTTWAFVSPEEYDRLIPRIAAYNASFPLKALIDSDDAKNVPEALDEARKVYDNTESTAEELKAAQEALNDAIAAYKANLASPDNPTDLTNKIVNPNFDGIKFDGWAGDGWGSGGTVDECAERYDMAFDTYQDIKGLSKGVYKVLVNGFFRGEAANTPYLYAKSGDDLLTADIQGQVAGAADEKVDGMGVDVGEGKFAPNSMKDFVAYENAGYYNDMCVYVPVGEGGDLRIGVKKANKGGGTEWVIVDTWRLIYYGDSGEAYKFWYEDVRKNIIDKMNSMVDDETKYDKNQKEVFNKALADGDAATDEAGYRAAIDGLNKAADETVASIEAYKEYVKFVDECRTYFEEHDDIQGDDVDVLSDYLSEEDIEEGDFPNGNATHVLDNCTLNTEEIKAETEYLRKLREDAIKNGMSEGTDVSNLLVNPTFKDGFDGWKKPGAGSRGGLDIFPSVEVYDNTVDISQEVPGVPNGLYSISCKAFYRPGSNGSYDGSEKSPVVLYMNNFKTPVQNICGDAIDESQAVDMENCYLVENTVPEGAKVLAGTPNSLADFMVEGQGYVPNSMTGASVAFKAGRYTQTVYGLVTDGTMKIGLTSNGVKAHWVLWSDFKLTYMGKNADAMESVIADLSQNLSEFVEENMDELSTPAQEAAANAIAAGEAAADEDDMWNALVAINDQLTATSENVAAFKEAQAALDAMTDEAEAAANPSDDAIAAYEEAKDKDLTNMTTEELKAAADEFKTVTGKLRIPADIATATDDNPIDLTGLFNNPSFDESVEGWQGDVPGNGNHKNSAEFYDKTFNMYQEFNGLPAGTYEVRMQGYYRQGSAENDYKNYAGIDGAAPVYNAKLYANADSVEIGQLAVYTTESKEAITNYAKCGTGIDGDLYVPNNMTTGFSLFEEDKCWNKMVFKYDGNGPLRIGIAKNTTISTDWTLFDNFQLFYYGENSALNAIEAAPAAKVATTGIYNAAGVQVNGMQKGINIVKMSDGSVRKIIVK